MLNSGWIKLHIRLLDWECYDDINTSRLFLHCLLRANHSDTQWRGIEIKRGTFITSLSTLKKETGLSIQNIRTSLAKLKSTHELTHKRGGNNQVISMVHYDLYQETNTPTNIPLTDHQQTTNRLLTTDKNDKNIKNEKEDTFIIPKKNYAIDMINIWKEICIELSQPNPNVPERNKKLNSLIGNKRFKDFEGNPLFEEIEDWKAFCQIIHKSDWLCGRVKGKEWKATIDWVLKSANLIKIHEGNYVNKENT